MPTLRSNVFVDGSWYGPAHDAVVSDEIAAKVDPGLLEPEPEKPEPEKPKPKPAPVAAAKKK
jgi:hypothetical protein